MEEGALWALSLLFSEKRLAHDRLFHLGDGLGDLDLARTGERALEDRPAAPDALHVQERRGVLGRAVVAAVEQETVRLHDRRRAGIFPVRPENRAGGGAASAQDALGRVVEA